MPTEPHVAIDVHHRLGSLTVQANLRLTTPWTVLFGPSGSGKSTLLRLLAGFLRPETGRVALQGQAVAEGSRFVRPDLRPMRWAGQQTALFPRLNVRQNLELGLGRRGASVDELAEAFALTTLLASRPAELSGGQRQRVAVARAAAGARGKVLLLDEPFNGLDAQVRGALIASLRVWLGASPVVSVTHDVGEASLLQAEVVRLDAGKVVAQGPVHEVLAEERLALRSLIA